MYDLTKVFSIIYRQSQIFYSKELKDLNITSGQFMYIICICENPGLSQDLLSSKLHIDKSTVAKTVQQLLLKEDYIIRTVSKEDKRVNNLFPTSKSTLLYPEILKVKQKWHDSLTQSMTDIEKEIFEMLLDKVFLTQC